MTNKASQLGRVAPVRKMTLKRALLTPAYALGLIVFLLIVESERDDSWINRVKRFGNRIISRTRHIVVDVPAMAISYVRMRLRITRDSHESTTGDQEAPEATVPK